MVIVPHEDDEILMAAGLIYRLQKEKVPVEVVMVTNGDYGCTDFRKGRKRLQESIEGLGILGISQEQFTMLGYADTGMPAEDSFITHLFEESDAHKIYPSACGSKTYGLAEKAEYHLRKYGKHADYTRQMLKDDLKGILSGKRPDNIVTTSEFDLHGDHAALYRFVLEILEEIKQEGYSPALYCGLIHSCAGDDKWPLPDTEGFTCPEGLERGSAYRWDDRYVFTMPEGLCLTDGRDNLKRQALEKHRTALEPDAVEFLMSFIKNEEIFWKVR